MSALPFLVVGMRPTDQFVMLLPTNSVRSTWYAMDNEASISAEVMASGNIMESWSHVIVVFRFWFFTACHFSRVEVLDQAKTENGRLVSDI